MEKSGERPQGDRSYFDGANCRLSAVEFGDRDKPALVVVHGMRDHALSMMSIVEAFVDDYHIVVPDLRGHGDSDNPGSYTLVQFVADLLALHRHYGLARSTLVGHSLGGHIASMFAVLYPEQVEALVLIDGMGPPRPPQESTPALLAEMWRGNVETALTLSSARRQMVDEAQAFDRLSRNNPRLDPDTARLIAIHGVEPHPDGGVQWKWDPSVQMVWSTTDHGQTEQQFSLIECPVLIVTGEHSMAYWLSRSLGPSDDDAEALHQRENERRVSLFRDARHVTISGAGHMIHYDQPHALNQVLRQFLQTVT